MAVVIGLAASPTPIPIHIRPANSHGTLAATANSLAVFLIAIAVWGIAYSLSFLGGLTLVNAAAPDRHRAASLSAFYLVAYFVQGAVALLLGPSPGDSFGNGGGSR
jgi:cyanate permease